jgi:hypothetical protein
MRISVSSLCKVGMALVVATVVAAGMSPAGAASSDEMRLLALTNQVRAANGLPVLTINGHATNVAQRWAGTLAERGVISHNASLPGQVTGWKDLGENVGVGGTVDAVHDGFLASPTHRANIVDPSFTEVGFGIVRPDARIFVVVVFMQPVARGAQPVPTTVDAAVTPPPPVTPTVQRPAAVTELSPWMVVSLEQSRSMRPSPSQ